MQVCMITELYVKFVLLTQPYVHMAQQGRFMRGNHSPGWTQLSS